MHLEYGDRIRMIEMPNDPNPIMPGETGIVQRVQAVDTWRERWYQVYVKWDSGRSLMLSMPPDRVEIVSKHLPMVWPVNGGGDVET